MIAKLKSNVYDKKQFNKYCDEFNGRMSRKHLSKEIKRPFADIETIFFASELLSHFDSKYNLKNIFEIPYVGIRKDDLFLQEPYKKIIIVSYSNKDYDEEPFINLKKFDIDKEDTTYLAIVQDSDKTLAFLAGNFHPFVNKEKYWNILRNVGNVSLGQIIPYEFKLIDKIKNDTNRDEIKENLLKTFIKNYYGAMGEYFAEMEMLNKDKEAVKENIDLKIQKYRKVLEDKMYKNAIEAAFYAAAIFGINEALNYLDNYEDEIVSGKNYIEILKDSKNHKIKEAFIKLLKEDENLYENSVRFCYRTYEKIK